MDLAPILYAILFGFLAIVVIYEICAWKIPTRLAAADAPKSSFGLVPIGNHATAARARGIE